MAIEKRFVDAYDPKSTELAKSTCLSLAQILGAFMADETVIVGGIVPTLMFSDAEPDPVIGSHVGTLDVDLALSLVILNDERYTNVRDALKARDFAPDVKVGNGAIARQRWRHSPTGARVDFLMPPVPPDDQGRGVLQSLEPDFAATTMLGLDLALEHRKMIQLDGDDLIGRSVAREVPVCHPAVFVMLKALAMSQRDANKDAYDLFYVLKLSPGGPGGLGKYLRDLPTHQALGDMERSMHDGFKSIDATGPRNVCEFLRMNSDSDLQADVFAHAQTFLEGYNPDRRAARLAE